MLQLLKRAIAAYEARNPVKREVSLEEYESLLRSQELINAQCHALSERLNAIEKTIAKVSETAETTKAKVDTINMAERLLKATLPADYLPS